MKKPRTALPRPVVVEQPRTLAACSGGWIAPEKSEANAESIK